MPYTVTQPTVLKHRKELVTFLHIYSVMVNYTVKGKNVPWVKIRVLMLLKI